jgi:hypothetical protein
MLAHPESRLLLLNTFLGSVVPIEGAACGTPADQVGPGTTYFGQGCPAGTTLAYTFKADSATTVPLTVQAASSQTANLQQWKDSAGNALAGVNSAGKLGIGTTGPDGLLTIKTSQAAGTGESAIRVRNRLDEITFVAWVHEDSDFLSIYRKETNTVEKVRIANNSDSWLQGGNVGIGRTDPKTKLHVAGKIATEDRLSFLPNGATSTDGAIEMWRAGGTTEGRNIIDLQSFDLGTQQSKTPYTLLSIKSPGFFQNPVTNDREATLSLSRDLFDTNGNSVGAEFLDLYNNGYSGQTQYGIRIQKRGTGAYRNFVIDRDPDGSSQVKLVVIKTDNGNVGIGDKVTPAARLDVFGGDIYVSSAGNGVILKSADGSICKKLTIDNSGNPVWTTVTCP